MSFDQRHQLPRRPTFRHRVKPPFVRTGASSSVKLFPAADRVIAVPDSAGMAGYVLTKEKEKDLRSRSGRQWQPLIYAAIAEQPRDVQGLHFHLQLLSEKANGTPAYKDRGVIRYGPAGFA